MERTYELDTMLRIAAFKSGRASTEDAKSGQPWTSPNVVHVEEVWATDVGYWLIVHEIAH